MILLGVGAFFIFGRKSSAPATSSPTSGEQPSSMSTLRDLIAKGISQSCTYSTDRSYGTLYLSGGKIRGDFNVTVTGANNQTQTSVSHMIIMDSTNYLWTEGVKTGIKMSFDQNATPAPVTSNTPTNSFDANALNNYKCSPWVADESMFVLPAGVTFRTFNLPSPAASSAAAPAGGSASQCSYCTSLTGNSKAQCLAALNCK